MFKKFVLLVTLLSAMATMFGCDRKMESSAIDAIMADSSPETDAPTISLQLHPEYDTGFNNADGITNLGSDDTVSLIATLSNGTFRQGDSIYILLSNTLRVDDNPSTIVMPYKVGILPGEGWLDADGHDRIVVEIPRITLWEGVNYLQAKYYYQSHTPSSTGETLAITVDPIPPTVTISHHFDDLKFNIAAMDADHGITMWRYKVIAGNDIWGPETAADGTIEYIEGSELIFGDEVDNGKKVGFIVTDAVGNTTYATSEIIEVPNL